MCAIILHFVPPFSFISVLVLISFASHNICAYNAKNGSGVHHKYLASVVVKYIPTYVVHIGIGIVHVCIVYVYV